ncbi:hypothetical protein ZWY2020_037863 [Hordeum vulgare]|nr:hypothetical protein ZWY2020_037863 [Hordeum vulgare]
MAPPEYKLPPEQFILREDGDPDDSPGLLVALRASQATTAMAAREEAKIVAAIQAATALAANPQPVGEDNDVEIDLDGPPTVPTTTAAARPLLENRRRLPRLFRLD